MGAIDSKYRDQRHSYNEDKAPNTIRYNGWSKSVYEVGIGYSKQGRGFKGGDIVVLAVDLSKGSAEWQINGKLDASHKTNKLQDPSITWVPLLVFYETNDQI